MSDYAKKLATLADRKKKLHTEEMQLIERRKKEMGDLAERFDLLTASDAVLIGVLSEVQTALLHQPQKIQHWENEGSRFRQARQLPSKGTSQTPS